MGVTIIAEAGVNHNGERDLALALVDAARRAGADIVKFQTFKAENVILLSAPKADYQNTSTDASESQFDMLRKLEMGDELHRELIERCADRGIEFLSTVYDLHGLGFLVQDLGMETLKIASAEITNGPLLLEAARSGRKIILSTGMSTLEEVEVALGVLAFGFTASGETPSKGAFQKAYASQAGIEALRGKVTLLQCTTEYPTPYEDVNLRAMETLTEAFGLPVGFSDHTPGIAVAIAAAALGAVIVEKHFTLDRTLPGPDHGASLEPGELADLVASIRIVEKSLGSGSKAPAPSESKNAGVMRKSLVTLREIKAGETFTEENMGVKRPGGGISPMAYWDWLGSQAAQDLESDSILDTSFRIPRKN